MDPNIMVKAKERDSNIELLRIIAMLLLMMVHANFFTLGPPTQTELNASFLSSFMRFFCESLCIICVNVFILISGWFGINAKIIRLIEFIFQVFFIAIFIHVVLSVLGIAKPTSFKRWANLLLLKDIWFVRSYIVFYILTPVLNAFVKKSTKKQLGTVLILFYIVQTLFGGFITSSEYFSGGYSPLSFMGLYLLGRYARLYPNNYTSKNKYYDLLVYSITALLTTILSIICVKVGRNDDIWRFYGYSSPIVVISSLFFFLFFSKLKFKNRIMFCCFSCAWRLSSMGAFLWEFN